MANPLELLQNKADTLENKLTTSPTAYARNTAPSSFDLSTDYQLASVNKQIDDLKGKQIRNRWYGPSNAGDPSNEEVPADGMLISGLKALSKPLNAIAGTAQYALGKGTESSLTGNINKALKSGTTFGDILKQSGAPRGVQIPLGFALDIMFDPVNWATAGTAALIPRTGLGLVKGLKTAGVKGALETAGTGLKSSLAKKSAIALNLVPFAKNSEKYASFAKKMSQTAIKGAEKYDNLMGTTVFDRLNKLPFGAKAGILGNTAENAIRKIPSVSVFGKATPTGEQIADFFKYSPKKANEIADLRDKVINLAKDKGAILTRSASGANFQSIDDFLKPDAVVSLKDKVGEAMDVAIRDADGILKPEYRGQAKVADSLDTAKKLLEMSGESYNMKNLVEAYKVTPAGKTGVEWYDNVIDSLKATTIGDGVNAVSRALGKGNVLEKVKSESDALVDTWNSYGKVTNLKPFEKLLSAQQGFISLFKAAKVPMNVSSHVVSVIGNFFMGAMMGLPVWKPGYLESMMKANKLVRGTLGAAGFKDMFFGDVASLIDMADNNPTRFKQLTGMDPQEIANKLSIEQKITSALNSKSTAAQVKKVLLEAWDNVDQGISQGEKLSSLEGAATKSADFEKAATSEVKQAIKEKMGRYETPSENLSRMMKEAPIRKAEETGTWSTSELTPNRKLDQVKEYLAKVVKNSPNNYAAKVADAIVNTMPRWYEHIDQSFKIGTTDYLTKVGLTGQELVTISRTTPMTKADILEPIVSNGEKLYRLTPLKAAEVATEAYMNYSAMPDFVRIMRAIPVVGSPFMSFPYAMAIKTAKTAINNPALFNKIGFMINEMNTGRSPQEKAAMEEKYNQYLKSPTVVKLFGMWNTNVKNFVPYYTMNMFNPSQRTYDDSTQGKILKMTDKLPVFQDPVGQVIKDYFIQPWILSGTGQIPQGQFGEPIYPAYDENGKKTNVGLGTKAFYGGRAIAESLVPGSLSYLGLANAPLGLSPEAVNLIPSYGARNLANATQGRSSIGAITKEDAVRKTFRSLLGRTGIPAYTLDVTKTSSK